MTRSFLMAAYAWTLVALPAWSQGDLAKGQDAYQTYLQSTNAYTEALGAGNAAAATGHAEAANTALAQARYFLELGRAYRSDDAETLIRYGDVLRLMNDFDLAAKVYRRVSRMNPGDAAVWLNFGRSLSKTGESKEAVDAFRQCIELSGGAGLEAEALVDLGDLYLERGIHALAEEQYVAALEASSEFVVAKIALASLKVRLGFAAEADRDLEELGDIGAIYDAPMQQYLSRALKDFDEARLWVRDDAENQRAYAKLLKRVGRAVEAIAPLKRSLALDGQDYEGWNLLASLYRQIDDTTGAQGAFVKSLEINPDQPEIFDALEALGGPPR